MDKKDNSEIYVFSKGYFALVAFFLLVFMILLSAFIYLYFIDKRPTGIACVVSIVLMIVFGGSAIFTYSMFGSKVRICDGLIIAKKWYGKKTAFYVGDIDEVVFEKSEGEIVAVSITVNTFRDRYIDEKINFEEMTKYFLENVEREKMVCYQLGTKKVMPI